MVDFGSGQGLSDFEAAGGAVLRRGFKASPQQATGNVLALLVQKSENTGMDQKMPLIDEH